MDNAIERKWCLNINLSEHLVCIMNSWGGGVECNFIGRLVVGILNEPATNRMENYYWGNPK